MRPRQAAQRRSSAPEAEVGREAPLILLAEDDLEMRRFLARSLRRGGFEVEEARDGAELLERLASSFVGTLPSRWPDVVVSDVRMPRADGLAVLEALRRADWSMPFILITAFGNDLVHEEAKRLGAMCFDKPFDTDDLLTAIMNVAPAR